MGLASSFSVSSLQVRDEGIREAWDLIGPGCDQYLGLLKVLQLKIVPLQRVSRTDVTLVLHLQMRECGVVIILNLSLRAVIVSVRELAWLLAFVFLLAYLREGQIRLDGALFLLLKDALTIPFVVF